MSRLLKSRGQILLPALAAYLTLLMGFFGLLHIGKRTLTQMRLDVAAEAAALSTARAQAEMLNQRAGHNLAVNAFVNLSYHGLGAMQKSARAPFKLWLKSEQAGLPWSIYVRSLQGYCAAVGRVVAGLNGAEPKSPYYPRPVQFQLEPKDMGVILLKGYYPVGYQHFPEAYYARQWRADARRAQPTHTTTWLAGKGLLTAAGSARVYLDLKSNAPLHNGGFPRLDEKWGLGDLAIQSFYPQFNARLIQPSHGLKRLLEAQWRTGIR